MDLVRKQTYITPEQDRALKRAAARRHTTEAHIVREVLESWLRQSAHEDERDPFERLLGFVEGPEEVDHDDIYRCATSDPG